MRIKFGLWELRLYGSKLEKRIGICSVTDIDREKHALLFDFDETELSIIVNYLTALITKYNLPSIYVFESSPNNYHAYSFCGRSFREVVHILTDVPNIDMKYVSMGIVRGYFTLRISPRGNDLFGFQLVAVLPSMKENEINPLDLTVNAYLTSNKGKKGDN